MSDDQQRAYLLGDDHSSQRYVDRSDSLNLNNANQADLSSSFHVSNVDDCDLNSPLASWILEVNPLRWLVIDVLWCIAYTVSFVALFWGTKHNFFYTRTFYFTTNIASSISWVLQTALSAYWFWSNLGLVRTIEFVLSLYFVIDALLIILIRDTSNPSKFDVVLDYGVSVVAYIWALKLGIKSYLDAKDGFVSMDVGVQDDPQVT